MSKRMPKARMNSIRRSWTRDAIGGMLIVGCSFAKGWLCAAESGGCGGCRVDRDEVDGRAWRNAAAMNRGAEEEDGTSRKGESYSAALSPKGELWGRLLLLGRHGRAILPLSEHDVPASGGRDSSRCVLSLVNGA